MMNAPIALSGVGKNYRGRTVLSDLSLTLVSGRIHALVGENGAGKSTALSILAGLVTPDEGVVLLDGKPVSLQDRLTALRSGIGLVPQSLSLVPGLTLVENMALTEPTRLVNRKKLRARLASVAEAGGQSIPLDMPIFRLSFAERQMGELAIALAQGARVLLLDEPTSSTGPLDGDRLFRQLRALADGGVAILFVTHRIDEVRHYAHDVTVLSRGRVTLQSAVPNLTDETLVSAMIGHAAEHAFRRDEKTLGSTRLVLTDISLITPESVFPGPLLNLAVHAREILGIVGVAGNGQSALAAVASGLERPAAGRVLVDGHDITGAPVVARRLGLGMVPEERSAAMLPGQPLMWSAVLGRLIDNPDLRRAFMLVPAAVRVAAAAIIARSDVRPAREDLPPEAFSGGNQQKFLLGRELGGKPSVAVLHGPTQGLDPQAAQAARVAIRRAAEDGAAILLISADLDEVLELADTVAVLARGAIVDHFPIAEYDRDRIGSALAGLTKEAA